MENSGSRSSDDYIHFVVGKQNGNLILKLDEKVLDSVERYRIESSALPGTAKLSLEMIVQYP